MSDLKPHEQRVCEEKVQLEERRSKLEAFIGTPAWSALAFEDRQLLSQQLQAMTVYADILGKRIARFTRDPNELLYTFMRDAAPSDADPMGQGFERVAVTQAYLNKYGIAPVHNGDQSIWYALRREIEANGIREIE